MAKQDYTVVMVVALLLAAYGVSQGWFAAWGIGAGSITPPPSGAPPADDGTPPELPAYHGYASCPDWRIAEGKDYNGIAADSEACYQKAFDHCRYHEWGNPQDVFATDFVEPDCCIWECYNPGW